eukprot:366260-Chlamydomonas_euryale.AAC.10
MRCGEEAPYEGLSQGTLARLLPACTQKGRLSMCFLHPEAYPTQSLAQPSLAPGTPGGCPIRGRKFWEAVGAQLLAYYVSHFGTGCGGGGGTLGLRGLVSYPRWRHPWQCPSVIAYGPLSIKVPGLPMWAFVGFTYGVAYYGVAYPTRIACACCQAGDVVVVQHPASVQHVQVFAATCPTFKFEGSPTPRHACDDVAGVAPAAASVQPAHGGCFGVISILIAEGVDQGSGMCAREFPCKGLLTGPPVEPPICTCPAFIPALWHFLPPELYPSHPVAVLRLAPRTPGGHASPLPCRVMADSVSVRRAHRCGNGLSLAKGVAGAAAVLLAGAAAEQPAGAVAVQPAGAAAVMPAGAAAVQQAGVAAVQAVGAPAGVAAVQPAGVAAVQPAGAIAVQPAGVHAVQPAGVAAVLPAGVAAVQPAGVPAVQPAGVAAVLPAGVAAVQPAGAAAVQQGSQLGQLQCSQLGPLQFSQQGPLTPSRRVQDQGEGRCRCRVTCTSA